VPKLLDKLIKGILAQGCHQVVFSDADH
jgi:hypothetical protein